MLYPGIFAILLLVLVTILIMSNKLDQTVVALVGASLALIFLAEIWPSWAGVPFTYDTFAKLAAEQWIDWRTLIVILSIMIVAEPVKNSGLFQFIAVQAVKLSGGRPRILLATLCLVTFAVSALLTDMAAMILVGMLTIIVCDALAFQPQPFLIAEALVTSAGSASTLIAGPPNMLLAGASGYDFIWFLVNLTPITLIMAVAAILLCCSLFRKQLKPLSPERRTELMELDAWTMVPDRGLFYRVAILLTLMVAGFILYSEQVYIVAFIAAVVFLLSGRPQRVIKEVEWSSILFFIGLFIVVGLLQEFGVTAAMASASLAVSGGSPAVAPFTVLWSTALATNVVDDTAFTLTFIPVVKGLVSAGVAPSAAWIAMTMGIQLGGFIPFTSTGGLLAYQLASREHRPIAYRSFIAAAVVVSLAYLGIGSLYLLLRLLLLPAI
jgi:Na+/H+ antiporter NhaD/arsenite permease-like protein